MCPVTVNLSPTPCLGTAKDLSDQSNMLKWFPCLKYWLNCVDSSVWSKPNLLFLQTPLGLDYKDCLINKNGHYSFSGVQKSFSSLRELTSHYQHNKLLLAEVPVKLTCCCPPRPKGISLQATSWYQQQYKGEHTELWSWNLTKSSLPPLLSVTRSLFILFYL